MTDNPQKTDADSDLDLVAGDLRRGDRDRYLTALFAPAKARAGLIAVYGLNLELARLAETTSEELIGRMRLQWWRERIDEMYQGAQSPKGHPALALLTQAIRDFGLERSRIDALIEARASEITAEPPESLDQLIERADQGAGSVMALAGQVLIGQGPAGGGVPETEDGAVEALRQAARAQALTGAILSLPFTLRNRRMTLPVDLCRAAGLDVARLYDRGPVDQAAALAEVSGRIGDAAEAALLACRRAPRSKSLLPALMPARLAARDLARLKRAGGDPFDPAVLRVDGLRPLILLAAAVRGKV